MPTRLLQPLGLWRDPDHRAGGTFRIGPRENATISRRYIDKTPVIETIFETPQGAIRLIDLLAILDGIDTLPTDA